MHAAWCWTPQLWTYKIYHYCTTMQLQYQVTRGFVHSLRVFKSILTDKSMQKSQQLDMMSSAIINRKYVILALQVLNTKLATIATNAAYLTALPPPSCCQPTAMSHGHIIWPELWSNALHGDTSISQFKLYNFATCSSRLRIHIYTTNYYVHGIWKENKQRIAKPSLKYNTSHHYSNCKY